jgi:hypothetical protein
VLDQCAWAAAHTRHTDLGAQFWHLAQRIGNKKAAVAVGHSILVISRHLLTTGQDYRDLGHDWLTRRADPEHRKARLIRQLQDLGYAVTLRPAA